MSDSTCSPVLDGPAKRQYLSRFILITCIALISFFPINILLPSFPALAARFDTPSANVALSISLFTLVFSVSQLIAGPLSDKWGRKEVLLGCITLSILGAIGCTLASDYLTFLLFRSVQAMGCGFFVLGHALVEDLFEEQDRARVRLYYMTLSGSFVALSPLIGSWLQTTFDWQGSFYGFAVMALGMLIHALCILPSKSASPHRAPVSIIATLKAVAGNRDFLRYWWIAALVFACYFALISVTPPDVHGWAETLRIPVRPGADGLRRGLPAGRRGGLVSAKTHLAVPANQYRPGVTAGGRCATDADRQP